jgi:phi LC3 family holin
MNINLKSRLTNKGFWVALISAIVGVTQLLGYKVFPDNWADILNSVLGILIIMGVVIDPSTPGISDNKGGQ